MFHKLVEITPRYSEDITDESAYESWLATLKNNDVVLFQEFHPANSSSFDFNFEHWSFTKVNIHEGQYWGRHQSSGPFDVLTGKAKYWTGDKDWGQVFPARIFPIHYELEAHAGDVFIGDAPLYEPLFFNMYRHVFRMDSRCTTYYQFMRDYPFSYSHEFKYSPGRLIEIFTSEDIDKVKYPEDLVFCYSQYLKKY